MALALAIIGLLALGGLATARALRASNAERTTTLALDRVEAALTLAVLTDGALPCPDSRDTPDGSPDADWCLRVGLVPWRALGLALADTVDGWDNRLSYAMTPVFAPLDMGGDSPTAGFAPLDCDPRARTHAHANANAALFPFPAEERAAITPAAYALISHGPNGKGAIGANGAPRAGSLANATRAERETLSGRGRDRRIWIATDPADRAPDGTTRDDRVRWRPPGQVLLAAGCGAAGPGL
jgi:hypothetical protein